jgi:hypothetical protein
MVFFLSEIVSVLFTRHAAKGYTRMGNSRQHRHGFTSTQSLPEA